MGHDWTCLKMLRGRSFGGFFPPPKRRSWVISQIILRSVMALNPRIPLNQISEMNGLTLKCNKIEWTLILQHLIWGMVPFFGPFLGLNMFEFVWKDIWGEDVSTVDPRPWHAVAWHCGILRTADASFSMQRRPKKVSFGSSNLCWPSDVSVSWDYMISVLISLNHWFQPRIRMILGSPFFSMFFFFFIFPPWRC